MVAPEEITKEMKRNYLKGKLEEFSKWIHKSLVSISGNALEYGKDQYMLEINGIKVYINERKKWILRKLIVNLWQEYLEKNLIHHAIDINDYITVYIMLDNERIDWITIYEELNCCILIKLPPETNLMRFIDLLNKYFEIFNE